MIRLFTSLVLSAIIVLQYKLWLSDESYSKIKEVEQQIKIESELLAKAIYNNDVLSAKVHATKNKTDILEQHARLELGMIKPRETFFWVIDPVDR